MFHLNPFAASMCVTHVPVLQVPVFHVSASYLQLFIHSREAVASMHGYEEEQHEFLSIDEMCPPEFISEKRVRVLSCCSVNSSQCHSSRSAGQAAISIMRCWTSFLQFRTRDLHARIEIHKKNWKTL